MNLQNIPQIRIKKYPRGYAVESQHKTWYGKTIWKPVISGHHLQHCGYYFSSREAAQTALFSDFQHSVKYEFYE